MNLDSAIFYSNDIEKARDFYRDFIGLEIEYQREDKFISFIFPNGARLGIKKKSEERETPGAQTIFIAVDDIENFYKEIKEKNLNLYKELSDKPWGKEFSVLDPDNNKVLFIKRPR